MSHARSPYQWTGNGPRPIYMADFETTTDENDCRVWAWGLACIDDPENVEHGLDIESFIKRISGMKAQIYFHNLKFDGSFIIDYLLRIGYEYTTDQFVGKMQFSCLMSSGGKLFNIKVVFGNGKSIEFRDSLKKIPLKLADIPKAFMLEESKGSIDYHKTRVPGYEPTPAEWSYIDRDVTIVAKALRQVISSGMTKLTVAADSLREYKTIISKNGFMNRFPVLSGDVDFFIREAYRGGFTYADDRFRGRLLECRGIVLDVNSLYPFVMYERSIPYGVPEYFKGEPDWKDSRKYIFNVTFTARLKPDHLPVIQIKRNMLYGETDYQKIIDEPVSLTVTDVDWQLYNDHYDIEVISFNGGYRFRHRIGMFDSYIEKYMERKAGSQGGQRQIAKLFLNSLYGKFATNPDVTGKDPEFDGTKVVWRKGEESTRDPIYTAAGAYITAYAREVTIRAAQKNYSTFAYADTDSLHLLQPDAPEDIEVHTSELGAWKHEYDFTRAFYMRAKAYVEELPGGRLETHIAGVPEDVAKRLTFSDLYDGNILHGKLRPKTVPGGVVLVDTPFRLQFEETSDNLE